VGDGGLREVGLGREVERLGLGVAQGLDQFGLSTTELIKLFTGLKISAHRRWIL
jgi:hypothetical protein